MHPICFSQYYMFQEFVASCNLPLQEFKHIIATSHFKKLHLLLLLLMVIYCNIFTMVWHNNDNDVDSILNPKKKSQIPISLLNIFNCIHFYFGMSSISSYIYLTNVQNTILVVVTWTRKGSQRGRSDVQIQKGKIKQYGHQFFIKPMMS